ncbi:hypothetical protein J14TS2_52870 [Bacillus sp. J14TS2]|nr:hypothetical protein J14TS2_52870 [Bacillus sp. J14TS2]
MMLKLLRREIINSFIYSEVVIEERFSLYINDNSISEGRQSSRMIVFLR